MGNNRDFEKPPVRIGETHAVEIASIGNRGDGIAIIKNFVIIVPATEKGELVQIKITAVKTNVAFAEVLRRGNRND